MVESSLGVSHPDLKADGRGIPFLGASPSRIRQHWKATAVVATLLMGAGLVFSSTADHQTKRTSMPRRGSAAAPLMGTVLSRQNNITTTSVMPPAATTTSTPLVTRPVTRPASIIIPVAAPPATVPAAVAPAVPTPSVAGLVAEVEASGIEPGSNWSWSMGDTTTHCGAMSGAGTGCTFGANGLEYSVFSGLPTLALVAHELANSETQNDAVPNLLSQVASAAGGTTWSPTDGVASCLVAHFMGFQDTAAGTWQCPAALASTVAANIHDSV